MPEVFLVDTDVLIDAGHGMHEAVACLEQIEQHATLAISSITQMELIVGCRNRTELRSLEHFLNRVQVLGLSE